MRRPAFITLRSIIFPDPQAGVWIAQGLEYDICAQAQTLEDLHTAFEKALAATAFACIELGQEPFDDMEPAPQKFWAMYEKAGKGLPLRHPKLVAIAGAPPVKVVERVT